MTLKEIQWEENIHRSNADDLIGTVNGRVVAVIDVEGSEMFPSYYASFRLPDIPKIMRFETLQGAKDFVTEKLGLFIKEFIKDKL